MLRATSQIIGGFLGCMSVIDSLILSCSRPNIYFNITSPSPGTFIISLHYKGREKAILEMDLKIDDLLEKVFICRLLSNTALNRANSKKITNIC